jgi:hypothetical protein
MLIELWESLRGYDQWTPAEATVCAAEYADAEKFRGFTESVLTGRPQPVMEAENTSTAVLTWTDDAGKQYRNQYTVTQPSPLFGLYGGEKLAIRYNPANPQEFYLRELSQNQVQAVARNVLWGILLIVGSAISIWRWGKFLHIN